MSPMQQIFLGLGAVATKTYVDDVFSTFLYEGKGDNTTNSVSNNVDLTEGGMVWTKGRDITYGHIIYDSLRGQNYLTPNENYAQASDSRSNIAFNATGYTFGDASSTSWGPLNEGNRNFASWTFRKAPGFFDVVQYSGSGSAKTVAHSLGSIPGCILIKRTDTNSDWRIYHRDTRPVTPEETSLRLNTNDARQNGAVYFNDTFPSSSVFTVGTDASVNASGGTYIAYIFAGGESNASEARSVDFDGSDDQLNIPDSTDFELGNGDFTLETWIKSTQTTSGYFTALGKWASGGHGFAIRYASQDVGTGWSFFYSTTGSNYITTMGSDISDGQWHHIAVTRTGGNIRTFTDGILNTTRATTDTFNDGAATMKIGGQGTSGNYFDGQLSNVRLVKGTALYTSSFRPPYEPLTNITNTVLLCCNNSSVTGSTVTPGTITASSSPTASSDSPFDDPAAHVFGESGSESVIKCGSYVGAGAAENHVNVGFEPQWVMVKCTSNAANWRMFDSMRGIVSGGNDTHLQANTNQVENVNFDQIDLTPTGFKLQLNGNNTNGGGLSYVYVAIRRSDGYVGKPVELGTNVFAMDSAASGDATIPNFDSGFPVDFALSRKPATADSWMVGNRLRGTKFLYTENTDAEATESKLVWDSNLGIYKDWPTNQMAWMWKRHAGFDVVAFNGGSISYRHSLNQVPEMMFLKRRNYAFDWYVYHKGLNGGTNPENYNLILNSTASESNAVDWFRDTAPTSTHFTLGAHSAINGTDQPTIAMLFASVDGVSKVGSYTGSSSTVTVTTGFQPRFVIIRRVEATDEWVLLDTVRGWGSGNDAFLHPNNTSAQNSNMDLGAPTSTGFTVTTTYNTINTNGENFIYYAHA
jgi:hypothetical protein